ncbi:MAG: hydroxyacid dehydrogenase [Candidatus Hermodarchaeota archaeon]
MMKVLISDKLADEGVQKLKDAGLEVNCAWDIPKDELPNIIGEYDGLIVRSATQVRGSLIENGKNLKVIGRAGIGLDNIDLDKAKEMGIVVRNTPTATSITVAELALTFLMVCSRDVIAGTNTLRAGEWAKKELSKGTEVYGKTLGIVGFGRIGHELAKRAMGLGMRVLAYRRNPKPVEGVEFVPLDKLLAESDYISLHVPLTDESKHMISTEQFNRMKKGVCLLDVGRGGVVDLDALYDAIKGGIVKKAALDVFEVEPPGKHKLFELDHVIGTPHIGAATDEGQLRAGILVAEAVIEELKKL